MLVLLFNEPLNTEKGAKATQKADPPPQKLLLNEDVIF
jgi:hypothetical protein